MPDLNSMREVMQNPEFLRLFSSPETLQVDRFRILLLSVDEFKLTCSLIHNVEYITFHALISMQFNTEAAFSPMLILGEPKI